ncbi:hypothetical protein F2Q68_00035433 [Brassica cretica]|uniref:Uncharacterized protein n=1 Tax=Brassica cretica TaxID=69181 RepID=A0A8S9HA79_BRACR|nr:hypothetical protein F2Q68_00035433 [Brassica cretica]
MRANCNSCYAKPAMGPTTSKSPQMGYNSGIVAAYIDGEPVAIMKLSNRNWVELEPKEGNEESNKGEDKTGKRKQAPGGEETKRS